jgi:predicted short-subunit dehydrogenase-like oxidoreductase (DUF2520 family)
MAKSRRITLIGAGNVGWHLARHLENAGHQLREIYSRNLKNARKLVNNLYDAYPTDSLDFSESDAQIFLLAVPDDAIPAIVNEIILPENAILAHTSGSKGLEVLSHLECSSGVFYPLQTFSKAKEVSFEDIPILVEGEDKATEKELIALAKSLSNEVQAVNSDQRRILHMAAVFACNFTNHLLSISKNILETEDLSFDLLKPLLLETIHKALELGPENAQTGPAARKDIATIKSHLSSLEESPELAQIYRLLTESIMERRII